MLRKLKKGPLAGRMVSFGWSKWESMNLYTYGNLIDRTKSVNLFSKMVRESGDSRVTLTGIEVKGVASPGTFFTVKGGLSQKGLRTLFASNAFQNFISPSSLKIITDDSDLPIPYPNDYFEARSGIFPFLNLFPTIVELLESPLGIMLLNEKASDYSTYARGATVLWGLNFFNHKPLLTNDVWSLRFSAWNMYGYHGNVNFQYRYKWKGWMEWEDIRKKSLLTRFWHVLLWGTAATE